MYERDQKSESLPKYKNQVHEDPCFADSESPTYPHGKWVFTINYVQIKWFSFLVINQVWEGVGGGVWEGGVLCLLVLF